MCPCGAHQQTGPATSIAAPEANSLLRGAHVAPPAAGRGLAVRFITRSAACQWASATHSRAKDAIASSGETPLITRFISAAGRRASELATDRHPSSKDERGNTRSTKPIRSASTASSALPVPAKQQCLALSDERGQPLGAAPGRHDLQLHLIEGDLDVVGGHPDVGGDGDLGAAAKGVAVQYGDHRSREARQADRRWTASV